MIYTEKETDEPEEHRVFSGVYYLANRPKVLVIIAACFFTAVCAHQIYHRKTGDPMLPVIIFAILAIIFIVLAIKIVKDRKPHLKIATSGLWTRTLGFVTWSEIYAAVTEIRKRGKYSSFTYLDIYLTKNRVPDDIVCISLLKNYRHFEMQLNKRTQLRRRLPSKKK